jgi:hypothetical protein
LVLATSAAAQPDDVKLAELPDGMSIAGELIRTTNLGTFDTRSAIAWSADGKQVAYAGKRGGESMPVVGSQVGEAHDRVSRPELKGGHVFFHVVNQATESEQKHWILIDGDKLEVEDWITGFSASPLGDRVAYWTQPGALTGNSVKARTRKHYLAVAKRRKSGRWRVSRGEKYLSGAGVDPLWSDDGRRVFSCGSTHKGWAVISVEKREKLRSEGFDGIASIDVSADGSALAFVKTNVQGAGPELYFDGRRVGEHHRHVAKPTVDAAGKHVAYTVATKTGVTVAVDDEKQPAGTYDHIVELAFSPRGDRLAFVAVVGGKVSERYPGLVEGGEWFVVLRTLGGDVQSAEHARHLRVRDLVWNDAGDRLAYAARDKAGWRIVTGKAQSDAFDDVGRPHFLPESAAIGHGARAGRELWWKVLPLK